MAEAERRVAMAWVVWPPSSCRFPVAMSSDSRSCRVAAVRRSVSCYVAVNHTGFVRMAQTEGHLLQNAELLARVEEDPVADDLPQIDAIQKLEGNERDPIVFAVVMNGNNVGVFELGRRVCLAGEAVAELFIFGGFRRHRLDGHDAVENGIPGLVDDTHRSTAELLQDLVPPKNVSHQFSLTALASRSSMPNPTESTPCRGRNRDIQV